MSISLLCIVCLAIAAIYANRKVFMSSLFMSILAAVALCFGIAILASVASLIGGNAGQGEGMACMGRGLALAAVSLFGLIGLAVMALLLFATLYAAVRSKESVRKSCLVSSVLIGIGLVADASALAWMAINAEAVHQRDRAAIREAGAAQAARDVLEKPKKDAIAAIKAASQQPKEQAVAAIRAILEKTQDDDVVFAGYKALVSLGPNPLVTLGPHALARLGPNDLARLAPGVAPGDVDELRNWRVPARGLGWGDQHLAAIEGRADRLEKVLAYVNIDMEDFLGRTPLYYAVLWQRNDVAVLLLKQGADPSARDAALADLHALELLRKR